ncbi:hypothetical protein Scep_009895 [Stephania cephalantha]|uniref:Cathepsin propeptide inhibitor domain-containing protein n=1 Tax=Stephania cephalantha TaxID=152367 RepID=A0AAP0PEQ8_9MAGN
MAEAYISPTVIVWKSVFYTTQEYLEALLNSPYIWTSQDIWIIDLLPQIKLHVGPLLLLSSIPKRLDVERSMLERHEEWMALHGRVYKNTAEKGEHFNVFKENLEHIELFNKGLCLEDKLARATSPFMYENVGSELPELIVVTVL